MKVILRSSRSRSGKIIAIANYNLPPSVIEGLIALEEITEELARHEQQAVLTAKPIPQEEKMDSVGVGCVKLTAGCRRLDGQPCDPGCPMNTPEIATQKALQPQEQEPIQPFGNRCPKDGTFFDEGGTCAHGHHAD